MNGVAGIRGDGTGHLRNGQIGSSDGDGSGGTCLVIALV